MAIRTRSERIDLRLSVEERLMLTKLASHDGVDGSHVLRRLLREAFAASGIQLYTKAKRR
jgi:uncharacterized protein (DUF1778 family)